MRSLALVLVLVAACNQGAADPPRRAPAQPPAAPVAPTPSKVDHSAGAATYARLCAPCHAADGSGYTADHAPSLINPTFLESASDEFIRRSIVWGRPATSMAAYGKSLGGPLDDAEVDRVVAFLRAKGPAWKPLAPVARGDADRGAANYAKLCKTCHGDAKSRGEAPHLANPQFLMLASDAFIRHAIVRGRPGTKMLAYDSMLEDAAIDDLVAHVRKLGADGPVASLLPAPTGKEPLVINPRGKPAVLTAREGRFVKVDDVARALAAKQRMVIVDSRPPSDWRRAHITGAVSIPYHDMKRLADIPKTVPVIAYCACPHHLSGLVVDELIKLGHKQAYVLDEGVNIWHQRKYPITAAPGVSAPVDEPHSHSGHDHSGHGH